MYLNIYSDSSYLPKPKSRIHAGGYFYLSSLPSDTIKPPLPNSVLPPMNGDIYILFSIMRMVLFCDTEAELGADYFNAK